ncbi:GPI-anchored protein like [Heracleum sosnowskyi]|uniref:GPI-anchored protein like n=1 Tax=Heracleum sosnowskyi TaxID=360622 RepID=A0AAD8IEM6_9APIA|nr:GPI-anchored protein like [Heracleum sosnowskyi]
MGGSGTIKAAKTVMEMAEVALTAVECCHKHHRLHEEEDELESLRSENRRLKKLVQENLTLLHNIAYESASLLPDCPSDLHDRLMASVDSTKFLNQLHSLQADGPSCEFPFKEASGTDLETAEILVNVSSGEPSWWVWVTDEMVPSNVEERSAIDHENYVVVSEESVVDGVANFMARCVVSNPNAQKLTPEELQKTLTNALRGMSKFEKMVDIWHAGAMFYTLSTWGLALVGLYKARSVVRVAAMGVHTSSKYVLKAL